MYSVAYIVAQMQLCENLLYVYVLFTSLSDPVNTDSLYQLFDVQMKGDISEFGIWWIGENLALKS